MANPIQGYFDSTSFTLDVNGFPIWNRAVGSTFMAKFAHTALGNGAASVTTGGFQVVKKTGMTVTVKPYFICKDGYMMYQTAETDITFTSSTSKQVFYIGARLDVANNHFTGDNVAGYTTFVSATDIASCKLTITANAVAITDGMIEDLRYDAAYCGQIDEYRERSIQLIAALENALTALIAGGVPAHASNHLVGGSDPIPYPINLAINSNFSINQDSKSGTVVLSAGAYGHDMWKAGASGCTYTFATSAGVTTLTISAGSLIQVIDGANLQSGTVCLSWTGTAQGKIGSGSYSASGVTRTVTGGANLNIEFNTGTLSKVQLNYGSVALQFVPRLYADELRACQWYYRPLAINTIAAIYFPGYARVSGVSFSVMRVSPTATVGTVSFVGNDGTPGTLFDAGVSNGVISPVYNWTGGTVGKAFTASISLSLDARL